MSTTRHTLTIADNEYVTFTIHNMWGTHAYGIAYDINGRETVAVDAINLMGYCHTCAIIEPITRMLQYTGDTPELLAAARDAAGLTCDCA